MATTKDNLVNLRDELHLSDAEMSQSLNISLNEWMDILSGKQKLTHTFLEEVANAFHTPMEKLLGEELTSLYDAASHASVGERLKALEYSRLYTHNEMATLIGKSKRTWAAYLDGTRKVPEDVLAKLAEHFHLTVEELKDGLVKKAPEAKGQDEAQKKAEKEKPAKASKAQKASKAAKTPSKKEPKAEKPISDQTPIEAQAPVETQASVETQGPASPDTAQPGTSLHFNLYIQAQSGQGILAQSLVDILPLDATDVYVKPEEGKAYWTGNGRMGFVNLW